MSINLLNLSSEEITKTSGTRKLTIKGETKDYSVYKIPLELLYYNDKNGRISTWISKYNSEVGELDYIKNPSEYNKVLQGFIEDSNPGALNKTKNNIQTFGQRVAGVVLNDGRVIDGNRRFTCLRKLKYEEGLDCYFEAVILEKSNGITDKDIKRLELNLQHAEEKPVDYDPIDNLVDVYHDIVERKTFTEVEYAKNTSKSKTEVSKLVNKAKLMVEFLEFINAGGKYYIARELKLDGPLQEIMLILNKVPNNKKDGIKDTLFTNVLTAKTGDLTRYIRDIGNHIIKTESVDEYIENHEEVVAQVYQVLQDKETESIVDIKNVIIQETAAVEVGNKITDNYIEKNKIMNVRNQPVELMEKALIIINSIDESTISLMDSESKSNFDGMIKKVDNILKALGNRV